MDYIEVNIEIDPWQEEFAEIVIAETEQLGFESYCEEAPILKAYAKVEKFSEHDLRTVLSLFKGPLPFNVTYSLKHIVHQNWNDIWESSFTPVIVADQCTVKASFHKDIKKSRYNILIDPKMAFGTGHHNTTELMIENLLNTDVKERHVLDMGTGTGILAILAAKMGAAAPVHAIDIDPIAVQSAKENSKKNRVSGRIVTLCGDASLLQKGQYDLILANINRNILLEDISTYSLSLNKSGKLIMSGFFQEDIPVLVKEGEKYGLQLIQERIKENWASIVMFKQ